MEFSEFFGGKLSEFKISNLFSFAENVSSSLAFKLFTGQL